MKRRRSMTDALLLRQLSSPRRYRPKLREAIDADGRATSRVISRSTSPTFVTRFSPDGRRLAIGDEEGMIRVQRMDDGFASNTRFLAHHNAVFDVTWSSGSLYTGSGDQTVSRFDAETTTKISTFRGHRASVKSVAISRQGNVVATGARDGHVFVWDSRVPTEPTERLTNAHVRKGPRPRRRRPDSFHGVTSVVFLEDERTLLSGGSVDGSVKIWDLRRLFYRRRPRPARTIVPPGAARRAGVTSMSIDRTSTRVLVSYFDHHIRLYDLLSAGDSCRSFTGHRNESFYVKSALSTCGAYVASGSCDGGVYVWSIDSPKPLRVLYGHETESNDVDWRGDVASGLEIVSGSDDGEVRLWSFRAADA